MKTVKCVYIYTKSYLKIVKFMEIKKKELRKIIYFKQMLNLNLNLNYKKVYWKLLSELLSGEKIFFTFFHRSMTLLKQSITPSAKFPDFTAVPSALRVWTSWISICCKSDSCCSTVVFLQPVTSWCLVGLARKTGLWRH